MTGPGQSGAGATCQLSYETDMKKETEFTHIGRPEIGLGTPVNVGVDRASTLLFENAEDLYRTDIRGYGRHGAAVHDALETAFNALEYGAGTSLTPSGLSACTLAILSSVKAGDHVLLTDSVYGPVRSFCFNYLKIMNIETEIYDPRIGADIEFLIRDNTSVILLESPGSLTFEIQDIPAISKVAAKHGVVTIVDNTWASGLTFQPLIHGADISVIAATKYIGGHSDTLFGAVISRTESMAKRVATTRKHLGLATSPDDAYQILRGFRSLAQRFRHSESTSLDLATWLETRNEVDQILHPALVSHPDHALWKRDFTGGACLFGAYLKPCSKDKVLAFINALKLFSIGYSYGGYESLVIHCDPQLRRDKSEKSTRPLIRFACGLEHVDDLKDDISQALNAAF